jgi:hypothetical protein
LLNKSYNLSDMDNQEDTKPVLNEPTQQPASSPNSPTSNQTEDKQTQATPPDVPTDIDREQLDNMKAEAIVYAKQFAKTGTGVRKEPSSDLANDQGPYYWWEKQATYESNTWSVSYWEYDNKSWQIQATRVELKNDGHSLMTAYSLRKDTDTSFPGFQVYKEQEDTKYHRAEIEDIVYLNRVLKGLRDSVTK